MQQFSQHRIRVEALDAYGIPTREERELMDDAIRPQKPPPGLPQEAARLKEKLKAIKWLVRSPMGVADLSIEFVQAHEIEVVRCCEKQHSARLGNSVKLSHTFHRVGQVFDRLAGHKYVKTIVGKGQGISVTLNKNSAGFGF